jgi:hypothetical protein
MNELKVNNDYFTHYPRRRAANVFALNSTFGLPTLPHRRSHKLNANSPPSAWMWGGGWGGRE